MLEEVNKNTTPKHKAISEDKRDFKSPKHGDLFHQSRKRKTIYNTNFNLTEASIANTKIE